MEKTLILYYSLNGSTEKVAKYLACELDLPIERVRLTNDLKASGLSKYLIGGNQVIMKIKPKLKPICSNIENFDTILIGSPIWVGSYVPAIKTLLENGQIKNKKIGFFYCHDGGPNKAKEKITDLVNVHNDLVSTYALELVSHNFIELKPNILNWVKNL